FAPEDALGQFLETPAESAAIAFQTSAFSLKALAGAFVDLYPSEGASVVGMDFDATVAWPVYDWMGVAKAALEATARYLARDLGPEGIRVNLVSAGPLNTVAAGGIPGFEGLAGAWGEQAPLGWDTEDARPVADAQQPDLGLRTIRRNEIADRVDQVIHAAASVSFALPLAEARAINVEGTSRVLELAELANAHGPFRSYTQISSAYVAGTHNG